MTRKEIEKEIGELLEYIDSVKFYWDDFTLNVKCENDYEFNEGFPSFSMLSQISEITQSKDIDIVDKEHYAGHCSTCDYGSYEELTIRVQNVKVDDYSKEEMAQEACNSRNEIVRLLKLASKSPTIFIEE